MKKFALLAVVGLFFVADAAQAGVFRRGSGGCPGGVCGVSTPVQKYAAAPVPVPPPAVAERAEAPKTAPEASVAPTEAANTVAAPAVESTQRFARLRGLGRRR